MSRPTLWTDGPVAWCWFWLDLYGPDGRPSHAKVMATVAFWVALAGEIWWGYQLATPRCIESPDGFTCIDPAGITWPFVFLVAITLAGALGVDVFKAALKLRVSAAGTDGAP